MALKKQNMNEKDIERLVRQLPASPNVLGKDRYINAAVLIPLIMIDREYHLLFQQRAAGIWQGTEICFPGGKYDPRHDSDLEQTARREAVEELGIDESAIKILGRLDTLMSPMGITVDPFVAIAQIPYPDRLAFNASEVERIFTLPLSYLRDLGAATYQLRLEIQPSIFDKDGNETVLFPGKELGLPDKYYKAWGGAMHRVLVYKTYEGIIWGITAEIVNEILRILDNTA